MGNGDGELGAGVVVVLIGTDDVVGTGVVDRTGSWLDAEMDELVASWLGAGGLVVAAATRCGSDFGSSNSTATTPAVTKASSPAMAMRILVFGARWK